MSSSDFPKNDDLQQILKVLQEINRGNRGKMSELAELLQKNHYPEVVHELCEAIMLTLVQGEASEFRWRNKLENLSLSQAKQATPPPQAEKIFIWQKEGELQVDLSRAIFIPRLSNLLKQLIKEIHPQLASGAHDLIVEQSVEPEQLPELIELGINRIFIYARSQMARKLHDSFEHLSSSLSMIFHSLQLPYWGGTTVLQAGEMPNLPNVVSSSSRPKQIPTLLFPFYLFAKPGTTAYFCFVEHDATEGLLRITIDDPYTPTINLDTISHVIVKGLDRRIHVEDLRYVAKTVYFEILRAKENSARQLAYHFGAQKDFGIFQDLQAAGLSHLNTIMIYWSHQTEKHITHDTEEVSTSQLGRILLALEEKSLVEQLVAGKRLQVVFDQGRSAFLDISMRGQWLNISLDDPRSVANTFYYLNRMPHMRSLTANDRTAFQGIDILLIHHLTSEVLAVIRGLDQQACESLQVLFVRYNPQVPASYREALLTMPEDRFHFATLQKCSEEHFPADYFTLSDQFSSLRGLQHLKGRLDEEKLDFAKAMFLAAGYLFFKKALAAKLKGKKILIIEDGGYLAPMLNQLCLEGKTLGEALVHYQFSLADMRDLEDLSVKLDDWLKSLLVGSIEHTRNGYDALISVYEKFHALAFPACSIAVSNLKRFKEGDEVATSIIHAVESMLHILGYVISERNVLVLGSHGTIGAPLRRHLLERIRGHVVGIDIQVKQPSQETNSAFAEYASLDSLPDHILSECDLFIGVIGGSIFTEKELQRLFEINPRSQLFFASGSTKKVEFTHLVQFIRDLQSQENPTINGIPVILEETEVRDPNTYAYLGKCLRISVSRDFADRIPLASGTSSYFLTPPPEGYLFWKELFLLGDLMPINFFYSGVPTEIIDLVLTQLMQISIGLIQHDTTQNFLPKKVLAVDIDIDDRSNLI